MMRWVEEVKQNEVMERSNDHQRSAKLNPPYNNYRFKNGVPETTW